MTKDHGDCTIPCPGCFSFYYLIKTLNWVGFVYVLTIYSSTEGYITIPIIGNKLIQGQNLKWHKIVFNGQEPPSGESTTTECVVNYQLLEVNSPMGNF